MKEIKMKKKLIKIANQIITLEQKLQNGENMQENMDKIEKLSEFAKEFTLDKKIYTEKELILKEKI